MGSIVETGLLAEGPAEQNADNLKLYAWLVGEWLFDMKYFKADGTIERAEGEWNFAWALEGRAIVDVWTYPRRSTRAVTGEGPGGLGVTVRTWNPATSSWSVAWSAVNGKVLLLEGRRVGEEIVQEGREKDGSAVRWIFSEIEDNSFRWRAESSNDGGATWRLTQEMRTNRKS